ncbi:MAG: TetR/AcrR family transcriptional regulator [Deltaproteobacteria bacterium]|nr:TetR/AcrR family transcriptional regulator [Deltaproteobacteria bacterium]
MSTKRENILNTAIILFTEKGFNEASVSEIAKISGVAEGTIFYHFKSKNDLFISILKEVKEGISGEFDRYMKERSFKTGMAMTEDVIAFFLYIAAHRKEWFGLLHRHYPYELARTNSECREHLESIFNTLISFFEKAVILGNKDGSIKTESPFKTALLIFSMVNGLIWLKFNELYDISSLYAELLESCKKVLSSA